MVSALAALAVLAVAASPASAQSRRARSKHKPYMFELFKVELKPKVPAAVKPAVEKRLLEAIDQHAELVGKLDPDSPDPDTEPGKFEKYLQRRGQKAFKVNLEVTRYTHKVEEGGADTPRRLVVSISVRMFGETMPQRVMAFTGDGSSTIKVDIGRKLRKADSEYANDEAIKLAVADAITMSIAKLKEGPPTAKKNKKRAPKK